MTEAMFEKATKLLGFSRDVSTVRQLPNFFPSLFAFLFESDVQQNVKTVSSLLDTAQEKYAATQVLSKPEARNEEGLPLTEIHEELDEEGNVICNSSIAILLSVH